MKRILFWSFLLVVAAAYAGPEVFVYWGVVLMFLGILVLVVTSVLLSGQGNPKFLILRPLLAGAMAALLMTWLGDWVGEVLEGTTCRVFRAWEFAALSVALVNVPVGAVVGLLGALSRRWPRGLVIGAVLHAVLFALFVSSDGSISTAPVTVAYWAVATGIGGGGLAGALGGLMRSWHERANANSSPAPPKTGSQKCFREKANLKRRPL